MIPAATAPIQNESMLRTGKAMSRAPIISDQEIAVTPDQDWHDHEKIMIVACIVNIEL